MLECGHPEACQSTDDEDDVRCLWCEDVERLKHHRDALRRVLHDKAVIVNGGSPTIGGPIGLLEIINGTVTFSGDAGKPIADLGAVR